jgi:hypothetical protein
MACGCGGKGKKATPSLRGSLPRMTLPSNSSPPPETPKASVSLPPPAPVSNSAAARRIKQLNQQAILKSLGK